MLVSNDYADSNSRLAATKYMEMKTDLDTTMMQEVNGHTASTLLSSVSERSRHEGGGSEETCEEAGANYDQLKNCCSQRSTMENGDHYSHLSYK